VELYLHSSIRLNGVVLSLIIQFKDNVHSSFIPHKFHFTCIVSPFTCTLGLWYRISMCVQAKNIDISTNYRGLATIPPPTTTFGALG